MKILEGSKVVKGASYEILVVIQITMLTVQLEIRPVSQQIVSGF